MSPIKQKPLELSQGLSEKVKAQLDALPCFQGVSTERLCSIAQSKLKNRRIVEERLTAMLVIVGNTPLTDEVFQLPPTSREREIE